MAQPLVSWPIRFRHRISAAKANVDHVRVVRRGQGTFPASGGSAGATPGRSTRRRKVRYNRLVDIFLRVTAYSLQSHLRTTVPDVGQIETDEIYVGIRNTGQQFIIPVQAKGGKDQIGIVQVEQDLALCRHAFPDLKPRLVPVQFIKDDRGEVIVMFELILQNDELKLADEKHYRLVPASEISKADLESVAPDS